MEDRDISKERYLRAASASLTDTCSLVPPGNGLCSVLGTCLQWCPKLAAHYSPHFYSQYISHSISFLSIWFCWGLESEDNASGDAFEGRFHGGEATDQTGCLDHWVEDNIQPARCCTTCIRQIFKQKSSHSSSAQWPKTLLLSGLCWAVRLQSKLGCWWFWRCTSSW